VQRPRIGAAADRDLVAAFRYYLHEAGAAVARSLERAVDDALLHIEEFPGTGSRRYGHLVAHGEVRFWTLRKFPYAIFYTEHATGIEVIRVLHQASDIPVHLD